MSQNIITPIINNRFVGSVELVYNQCNIKFNVMLSLPAPQGRRSKHDITSNYMKRVTGIFILTLLFLSATLLLANDSNAATLASKLRGKILLQVEEKGEAWYVNPTNDKRYYLGRPTDAFNIMRTLGIGINEENYLKFSANGAPSLSGYIVLRVLAKGEAYYVHPVTYKLHYLGRPADAFAIMRKFGLGISNTNLTLIPTAIAATTVSTPSTTEVTATKPAISSIKKVWELAAGFTTPTWTSPYTHHCGDGICKKDNMYKGMIEYEDEFNCPIDCLPEGYKTYQQGQFYVVAKPKHEILAKTINADMQYCYKLIKNYLGLDMDFDKSCWAVYPSDNYPAIKYQGSGTVCYPYMNPEQYLDLLPTQISTGDKEETFWTKSSPTYCSNAHEAVHMFPQLSVDRWWSEGLAEYFTRKNHGDAGGNQCQENGYYGPDYLLGEKKYFNYLDLSNVCFSNSDPQMNDSCYETSTCMISYLVDNYGYDVINKIMTTFKQYDTAHPATPGQVHTETEFIDHGIVPVTGEGVRSVLLSRFGVK